MVYTTFKDSLLNQGFCVKLKDSEDGKIFINVCHSSEVPEPKDITDAELIKILESEDPYSFRIPMSVGEPHAEIDKSSQGCTVYDIIVHPTFYLKLTTSEMFRTFFLTVSIEGLETKYDITLKRDWLILKNRKYIGSLIQQNVRTNSKPIIQEMSSTDADDRNPLISEISNENQPTTPKGSRPHYTITPEPQDGHPEYLVAEIELPLIKSSASVNLDIGEDRILLTTRSHVYHLDIYLPYNLIQQSSVAQFNSKTQVLTVTLALVPQL